MFMIFPQINFTSQSLHFVWSQLQHRIKSWKYLPEFQCSQNNTFENTRKVTISIELLIESLKLKHLLWYWPLCNASSVQTTYFLEGNKIDSPEKPEHYEPFVLSPVKYSGLNLSLLPVCMQFIHTSR